MLPISLFIEIICLILAVIYLGKKQAGWYWYFIPFMFLIVALESTGYIMAAFFRLNNHWVYNIEMLLEIFTIPLLFTKIFSDAAMKERNIIVGGFFVMLTAFMIESIHKGFLTYNTFTYLAMSAIFTFYGGTYFYNLLKRPEPVNNSKFAPLWIVAGIFIFYFTGAAVNVFFDQLMQLNISRGIPLRYIIFTVLNAILYGFWSYAFRCRHLLTIS